MTIVLDVLGWLLGALLAVTELLVRNPWAVPPVAVLVMAALALLSPYRACRWCRPGGLVGGSWPGRIVASVTKAERKDRKRKRRCRRCKNTRQVRRLGAKQVHRVKVVLTEQWHEWRDE